MNTHISSSTEGFFVMADEYTGTKADFVAGPFHSQTEAQQAQMNLSLSLSSYSAIMAGQMESWADLIETAKRSINISGSFQERTDWQTLDSLVCRMRDSIRTWEAINDLNLPQ